MATVYVYWTLLLTSLVVMCTTEDVQPCRKYVFKVKAEQKDENGLQCWDHVTVSSCGGRCDSREVSDWVFPFKLSLHPVCMFASWRPQLVRLRNCDDGVAPGTEVFEYISADDCHCKVCSSDTTSCEWLPSHSHLLKNLVSEELDDEMD